MQFFALLSSALSLALAICVSAAPAERRHNGTDIFVRVTETTQLSKRYDDAKFTYYEPGLGACGETNTASQYVVALNSDQYDSGSYCFDTITISYGGKTTQATIVDRCPGCPDYGLDLSEGLFEYFADTSVGVIYGDWSIN
ncbi:plant expansin [Leucogyrophana mollusca]|uniref:Plant expansin n=1 Tax=Leucogyrophana mollusca TaxID=85980 RepID=A0ACB8BDU8_9AGAM|nr:plant expansin [Leucogyrophana mollusca]